MRTLFNLICLLLFSSTALQAQDVYYDISVGMNGSTTMHDGNTFDVWGFREGGGGMSPYNVPGPVIRAREGQSVRVHFRNTSMLPHTIHLHGLDVSQENDGVPQTSIEIAAMQTYDYDFIAPHAGTYAYHCHVHTVLHLQMGMYGAVVIESADGEQTVWEGGPAFDQERTWVTGEFDSYWHEIAADEDVEFPYHDFNPDYFLVNGDSGSDTETNPASFAFMDVNETLLIRAVNMGYLPHRYHFGEFSARVVSSDGRPLPVQEIVSDYTLYPGERYDFLLNASEAGSFSVDLDYLSVYSESVIGTASVPIWVTGTVAIDDGDLPQNFELAQNFPNPFNPATTISYVLPRHSHVSLKISNSLGQHVRALIDTDQNSGEHAVVWDGTNDAGKAVASGVYYYQLSSGSFSLERTMVLLK